MDWEADSNRFGMPTAVLNDKGKVVARIYLSPQQDVLRIVLPEFTNSKQLSFKPGGIIDFSRKVE